MKLGSSEASKRVKIQRAAAVREATSEPGSPAPWGYRSGKVKLIPDDEVETYFREKSAAVCRFSARFMTGYDFQFLQTLIARHWVSFEHPHPSWMRDCAILSGQMASESEGRARERVPRRGSAFWPEANR